MIVRQVPVIIGIDLGGTSLRVGAFDLRGEMLNVQDCPIEASQGPDAGIARTIDLVEKVLRSVERYDLKGIGVGATGPVDSVSGTINNPYTLPTWQNVSFTTPLTKHFGVPVVLENDADVAALGEYWKGAGQGVTRLFAVTVGTGIGTAFIMDGKIYRGLGGAHGDGGHHVIDPAGPPCYCGATGCWESLASGNAIAKYARQEARLKPTLLLEMSGGDPQRIDSRMVAEAARKADPLALEIIDRSAYYLALGMVNVIHLFVPEMIVLCGGVMHNYDLFIDRVQKEILKHNIMVPVGQVRVLPAKLGYYAGVTGAAYTIYQMIMGK